MPSQDDSWQLNRYDSQPRFPRNQQPSDQEVVEEVSSPDSSPPRAYGGQATNGRTINYHIADDDGNVDQSTGASFIFQGSTLEELKLRLEELTCIDGLILCTQSVIEDKLYPLRLHLPPNNATMNVVVVSPSSELAQSFGHG